MTNNYNIGDYLIPLTTDLLITKYTYAGEFKRIEHFAVKSTEKRLKITAVWENNGRIYLKLENGSVEVAEYFTPNDSLIKYYNCHFLEGKLEGDTIVDNGLVPISHTNTLSYSPADNVSLWVLEK